MNQVSTTVESVDPSFAAHLLQGNTNNRSLSRSTVDMYAAAMKRGEWMMNGEGIVISESGKVLNGQHRLHAVLKSGVAVQLLIVQGVPDSSFKTFDGGKRRNSADILTISGEVNTRTLAAALRTFEFLAGGATARNAWTSSRAIELLSQEPAIRYWSNQYAAHHKVKSIFTSSLAGVLAFASKRHSTEPLNVFMDQLESGAGLAPKSPALVLRERFQSKKRGETFSEDLTLAYYIKAINAHVQGKPLNFLRQLPDEAFPSIV
jgi:hypothetical protein